MNKRLFLTIGLLLVITLNSPFARAAEPTNWTPAAINYTIGNGQGASDPVTVGFTSTESLDNVTLEVVPGLGGFVGVEPASIQHVTANSPYDVRLRFSIPPGTAQGTYTGTLHLRTGSRTLPETLKITVNVDYGQNQIRSGTSVISPQTAQFLASISPDHSALVFTQMTIELATLRPGTVIALGSSPTLPNGFIGRVTSVTGNGTNVVVTTTPASLSDALSSVSVSLSHTLTQGDLQPQPVAPIGIAGVRMLPVPQSASSSGFSLVFNDVTLYDGGSGTEVTLNGSINVNPSFDISFVMNGFSLSQFRFVDNTTLTADIEAASTISASISKKFDVAQYSFTPITVWAGFWPIVFTPQLTLTVGIDGTVSIGLTASATQTSTLSAGLQYNGSWSPVAQFSNSFTFQPPTPAASADGKVFAGPQLNLLVYGTIGPFATVNPYIELTIDVFGNPQYQLIGGLQAAAGARLEFLGSTLGEFEFPALINYRTVLTQGNFQGVVVTNQTSVTVPTGAALEAVLPYPSAATLSIIGGLPSSIYDALLGPLPAGSITAYRFVVSLESLNGAQKITIGDVTGQASIACLDLFACTKTVPVILWIASYSGAPGFGILPLNGIAGQPAMKLIWKNAGPAVQIGGVFPGQTLALAMVPTVSIGNGNGAAIDGVLSVTLIP